MCCCLNVVVSCCVVVVLSCSLLVVVVMSWSSCWCRVTRCLSRESIRQDIFIDQEQETDDHADWRLRVVCFTTREKHTRSRHSKDSQIDSSLLILWVEVHGRFLCW